MHLHHVVLFVGDAERSLAFYRDGVGLSVLVDREYDGDWPALFGVGSDRLRAIILGDRDRPELGQVELLTFPDPVASGPAPPATATVMLSFMVDLSVVLPALDGLNATRVGGTTLRNGVDVVTLRDPDGVLVELLDIGAGR